MPGRAEKLLRSTRDKRSTSALEPARRSVANAVPRRHVRRGVRERCGKAESTLCPAAPTHAAEASQRRAAAPRVRQLRLQTSVCARCATPPPQRAGGTRPEAHSQQKEPRSCALASPAASLTWAAARSRVPCPSPYPLPAAQKREQPLASRAQAEPTTAAAAAWRTAAPRSTQRQARPRAGQDGALRVIAPEGLTRGSVSHSANAPDGVVAARSARDLPLRAAQVRLPARRVAALALAASLCHAWR